MLRAMSQADVSRLLVIEQEVQAMPWSEDTFKTCFQSGYLGWVIELAGKLVAFIIVSLRHEECHVLNLCVARAEQRRGLGRQLLGQALKYAKEHGAAMVYLEVRRSNSRAIALYRKEKFHLIGMRKDYYPGVSGPEDALVLARSLVDDRAANSC
jgi:ribosomal-protein-alanine N-acetyltransferase